jgi:hypothetical membrane protein
MPAFKDEMLALIAFIVALAAMVAVAVTTGVDVVQGLGLRDLVILLAGAFVALLKRSGSVTIPSDNTQINTGAAPKEEE